MPLTKKSDTAMAVFSDTDESRGRTAGFTLIEILISISIFAVLATMVYSSLNAVLSRNEAIKEAGNVHDMAKNALNRMTMDLTAMFVEQYPEYQVPGINDPPDPYRVLGEEDYVGGNLASRLTFVSTEHLGISSDIVSGLGRIVYYVEAPGDRPGNRFADRHGDRDERGLLLIRSDRPFPYDIDPDAPINSAEDPILCEGIESFSLTFVDENGQIHREWNSDSETYRFATPRAVIIHMKVASKNGTHDFTTRVDIPVYRERLEDIRRQ